MNKFKLLLGFCFLTFHSCNTSTQQSENNTMPMNQDALALDQDKLTTEGDGSVATKKLIGQLIDPSYSDASNFNLLFNTYIFSSDGTIESVSDSAALDLYQQIMDKQEDAQAPLFEVKDDERVILLLNGKGIWANVLIDKTNQSILGLQFHPRSKTSSLDKKEETLQKQFIGSKITFSDNNFSLKPWDQEEGSGDITIDGISGATDICQAAVDMFNSQLKLYQSYFDQ